MPNMTRFDKTQMTVLGEDAVAALTSFAADRGLRVEFNGGRAQPGRFTLQIDFTSEAEAKAEWDSMCSLWNLHSEDFGSRFVHRGSTYTIIGCNPNSVRTPILARNQSSRVYHIPASVVQAATLVRPGPTPRT